MSGPLDRWYAETMRNAETRTLPGGVEVRVASSPYFLATKLEAFAGRGGGDFAASHDLEDFIAVVDGRPTLLDEVRTSPEDVRSYLSRRITEFLGIAGFLDAVAGHLPSDEASQQRAPLVLERLRAISMLGPVSGPGAAPHER